MKEMTDLVFGNFALVDLVDLVCNFAPIIFIKYGNNDKDRLQVFSSDLEKLVWKEGKAWLGC